MIRFEEKRDEKQKENCAVFFKRITSVRKNYRSVWMIKKQEDDLSSFLFEYFSPLQVMIMKYSNIK